MRIAFVIVHCNRREGSSRPVNEVAERLVKRGHEVHLYSRTMQDLDTTGITWHRIAGPKFPLVASFTSFFYLANSAIKPEEYDIVHCVGPNTTKANIYTIQNIQPAKVEILKRLESESSVSPLRAMTRSMYLKVTTWAEGQAYVRTVRKRPAVFLPVSRGVEANMRDYYDIGKSPVTIIPNAADTDIFKPLSPEDRLKWRAANGVAADDILLVFSGGQWGRKGLDLGIRGLAKVPNPKVKLFVAGTDPIESKYKAMAEELGIADRVIFGGYRKDIATVLGAGDLFLFPSWYEAFSLATIEAAACGLPIVATKINGTEDFIQPGVTGEFVEHDPADIAAKLIPLTEDAQKRQEMSVNARELVCRQYTWDAVADETERIYNEFLKA